MGVFDNDLILPGVITEIESDYSFGYDTSLFGTTDSVTIIGTAFNGPTGRAVPVYSPEHAKYLFGGIYDYKSKKEATLVAEILNVWDRGCRTIYAVRISGKQIAKEYQLATTSDFKLKVSGIFPSNENKDVCFVYDDKHGASKISIFKPAKKATIQEKMQGFVEKEESILTINLDISNSYGLAKENRLTELIKIFNDHPHNNVIRLSVIDREGNDVTYSSKEAQSLAIGSILPGAYFVGRDENKGFANTEMNYILRAEGNTPFEGFEGSVFKKLIMNSDITKDLPIYAENLADLNASFKPTDVHMSTMFDFLAIPGVIDRVFGRDSVDYEEVELSEFDVYRRLGSGFATTAKAEFRTEDQLDIKVIETPVTDDNRIQPIQDGVYSMLENLNSRYRMLSIGNADTVIKGKTPKKLDFKIADAIKTNMFENLISVTPKVNKKDLSLQKNYEFSLDFSNEDLSDQIKSENLISDKTIEQVPSTNLLITDIEEGKVFVNKDSDLEETVLKEGDLFLNLDVSGNFLYRSTKGKFVQLKGKELIGKLLLVDNVVYIGTEGSGVVTFEVANGNIFGAIVADPIVKYITVKSGENVNIFQVNITGTTDSEVLTMVPVGLIDDVFQDEEDKTIVYIEDVNTLDALTSANKVAIKSGALDYTSLEELIELLNEHSVLSIMFEFSLTNQGVPKKDEYVIKDITLKTSDIFSTALPVTSKIVDKKITFDTSLYIPYKTTDNFARQLAQHCTYTDLKTAPTHGIIGTNTLVDTDLTAIANKVNELTRLDLNLYAKKPNGRDMLDANNLPYPIGRNVSVTVGQYIISTGDGYNYISNGAGGYAGMVSVLPTEQSSTNQPINIPAPSYELTNHQLGLLSRQGYVTFKDSYTKGIVVTDGVTMAPVTSPFRRLSVARTIGTVSEIIRAAAEPFIGQQNHLANKNSMQTAIKSSLDKIKGRLIEEYNFNLISDPAQARLGIVEIDFAIVPIYEITQVRSRISVKEKI